MQGLYSETSAEILSGGIGQKEMKIVVGATNAKFFAYVVDVYGYRMSTDWCKKDCIAFYAVIDRSDKTK